MDSLTIAAVVAECKARLSGARINKIFQPSGDEIYFRLWTGTGEGRLYLLSRPQQARLHLTNKQFPHPFTPPRFCQLLRSRLTRLLDFEQVGGDRLVLMHCAGPEQRHYRLLVDLRPKPNLVLLDQDDRIVDLLRRGGPGQRPGDLYAWPEQVRNRSLPDSPPDVPQAFADANAFRSWLLGEVAPISRLAADDMSCALQRGEAPADVVRRYLVDIAADIWLPRQVISDGRPQLALLPLYCLEYSTVAVYESTSQALDDIPTAQPGGGDKAELVKTVKKGLTRLRKRLNRIEEDYAGLDAAGDLQHTGNLLLSNLYLARRGMQQLEVDDYAADPPTRTIIQLDPRLTPQENADRLFKQARKRRRGEEHYVRRRQETRREIDWLEEMALALDETDDPLELDALKKQLAAAGYLKLREEPVRRQGRVVPAQQLEAVSPSGYSLVWGKNPRANDRISRELATPEDLWFHAHNLPGCHLILRRAGRAGEVPEEDVLFAATLAAGYSRGRNDSRVEVIVALAKDVKKPKGARPGLVTVDAFRTVAVEPKRIEDL